MQNNTWILNPQKFLSEQQAKTLLTVSQHSAQQAHMKGQKVAIRDYFIMHLALTTGLRVMEMAALNCGDIYLGNPMSSVLVRKGKGNKKRQVLFNGTFSNHCREFFKWKQSIGESIEPDQPMFLSSNTGSHMTTRALEKAFKRCARRAGLPTFYSIHCLRHTYATFLLEASSGNIRFVQNQLGHARLETTEIYTHVMGSTVQTTLQSFNDLIQTY